MFTSFFSLFIWPIQAVIQILFIVFMKAFAGSPGLTIVAISVVVNTLLLPIYLVADRWQREERQLLDKMRPKVADIRAVFRGDERQMILGTYYRQQGYHPLFSIRSSVGLLIQIPFFLAAYDFLSHSPALPGASFLFLTDLGQPDGFLRIAGVSINVLPFVMTVVNLVSGFLYTKGLGTKDKVQLIGLALVFLVLLYGSPSGLVLYWTVSNLFSLGKNAAMRLKRPGLTFHWVAAVGAAVATVLPALGLWSALNLKFLLQGSALVALVIVAPWVWKRVVRFGARPGLALAPRDLRIVLWAAANLTLLTGLVIPSLLVASSPTEFQQAWSLLGQTFLQSLSLFFLIPLSLWALSGQEIRRLLTPMSLVVVLWALFNCFVFPAAGVLNQTFLFTEINDISQHTDFLYSVLGLALALVFAWGLWKYGKRTGVVAVLAMSATALAITAITTLVSVEKADKPPVRATNTSVTPVFHLSPSRPNLFVVFLDRAAGVALPEVLEKAPSLRGELEGFVNYPNTLSFAHNTILGSPALFGGYEYTPDAMNARKEETAVSKVNQALMLLPKLFGEAGYRVTFTDPAYANFQFNPPGVAAFQGMKNVTALNIKGDNEGLLLKELKFNQEQLPEYQRFEYDILERFSIYRLAPPILRFPIYREGEWWNAHKTNVVFELVMNSYANLHYLSKMVVADSDQPTLNIMENETTHDNGQFGPDFSPTPWRVAVPPEDAIRFGDADGALYVYNMGAAFQALATWFRQLKAEGLWDNTKIILVADHGVNLANSSIHPQEFSRFNPLLMVKDFRATGPLRTDNAFMTNADVPAILVESLGGASNPWTGKPLTMEGKKGRLFVHMGPSFPSDLSAKSLSWDQTWELTEKSVFTKDGWKQR